ncbi:MAG TPA: DUF4129 domain-containing protein [Candidatus Limnocylindrales bacterium]|nr:DUF4129 domain-containing protein [Candidatus Limnocylindrales bacterium]
MRSNWWADVVEPTFVALTEGIWVAVLYLLFEVDGRAPITLNPVLFVLVAGVAALVSPRLNRFGSARWEIVGLAAIGVGVIGTLLGPGVLAAVLRGDPGGALATHPGGWLLGLATFRGMISAGSLDDPDGASRPFVRGVIALTVIWLYAGLLPVATFTTFRDAALGPTLVFATVGTAAIGLRRVHAISAPAGIEWWRNGAWLATLALLVFALGLAAVSLAGALVVAVPAVLGLSGFAELAIFVLVIAALAGSRRGERPNRSNLRAYIVLAIFLVIGAVIYHFLHPDTGLPPAAAGTARTAVDTTTNGAVGVILVGAVLVVIVVIAILVAQGRRRPLPPQEAGPGSDDSAFEVEGPGWNWLRRAAARLLARRPEGRPASAQAAYVATLKLLEPLAGERRLPHETPQAHASRMRRDGAGSLELDLLAADYELSRWGARTLSGLETRRAISRWERSRTWISARILAEEAARRHAQEQGGSESG